MCYKDKVRRKYLQVKPQISDNLQFKWSKFIEIAYLYLKKIHKLTEWFVKFLIVWHKKQTTFYLLI